MELEIMLSQRQKIGILIGIIGALLIGVYLGLRRRRAMSREGKIMLCHCGQETRLPVNGKSRRRKLGICKACFKNLQQTEVMK